MHKLPFKGQQGAKRDNRHRGRIIIKFKADDCISSRFSCKACHKLYFGKNKLFINENNLCNEMAAGPAMAIIN